MTVDEGAREIYRVLTGEYPEEAETVQESAKVQPQLPVATKKKPDARICSVCGKPYEPYMRGCVVMTKCKQCLNDKIAAKKKGIYLREKEVFDPYRIEIDFGGDCELFDTISDMARKQRRTVQQQIMFMAESVLEIQS